MITIRSTTPCACCGCDGVLLDYVEVPNEFGWATYAAIDPALGPPRTSLKAQCQTRGGIAALCGFPEYSGYASARPLTYLKKTLSGQATAPLYSNSGCTTPLSRVSWPTGQTVSGVASSLDADPVHNTVGGLVQTVPFTIRLGPAMSSDGIRPDWESAAGPRSAAVNTSMRITLQRTLAGSETIRNFTLSAANPTHSAVGSMQSTGFLSTASDGIITWRVYMSVDVAGMRVVASGTIDLGKPAAAEEEYNAEGEAWHDVDTCGIVTTGRIYGRRWDDTANAVVEFDTGVGGVTTAVSGADVPDSLRMSHAATSATADETASTGTCVLLAGSTRSKVTATTLKDTLSIADTEENAIDRLLAVETWSAWTNNGDGTGGTCLPEVCCNSHYNDRDAGFSFAYQEARWRVAPEGQVIPAGCYGIDLLFYRREAGSSDLWVPVATYPLDTKVFADGTAEMHGP